MTFAARLQDRKEGIARRWLEGILATYPDDGAMAFKRQRDPFANPVGHALREGTREILEAVLDGMDAGRIDRSLRDIIRIRAVQEFSPSQAVRFVFHLKEAVRAELGDESGNPRFRADVMAFEEKVDRLALAAFDVFVECRERVCELRVNEAKRKVAWLVDKLNRGEVDPAVAGGDPAREYSGHERAT